MKGVPAGATAETYCLHISDRARTKMRCACACRDAGLATAPGILPTDFENDWRDAGGFVDMGADEYAPHLYVTGDPAPGAMGDTTD